MVGWYNFLCFWLFLFPLLSYDNFVFTSLIAEISEHSYVFKNKINGAR